MNKRVICRWVLPLSLLTLAGCEALDARVHEELEVVKAENEQLADENEALARQNQKLQRDLAEMRSFQQKSAINTLREYLGESNFPRNVIFNEDGEVARVDLTDIEFHNKDLHIFQLFPKLERLTLWGAGITDDGMDEIAKLTQITHLTLFNTELTAAGLEKLKPLKDNLRMLNLRRSTYLTDEGLQHLEGFDKLVQLDLLYNNFQNEAMEQVSDLEQLKVIDLRGCMMVQDPGLKALSSLKNLQVLKLRNGGMTDEGLKVVSNFPDLKVLFVQDGSITDEGLKSLAGLKNMQDLTLYSLYGITDEGLSNLKDMPNLQTVSLRDTYISGTGLANLAGAKELSQLNISETDVNNDGLALIKDHTNLTWLDLWQTQIDDEGMKHLEGLEKLEFLSVAQDNITNEGLKSVAGLTNLQELDLQETKIDDMGLQNLHGLTKLKKLNVANTQVTPEGVAALRVKLPNLAEVVQ